MMDVKIALKPVSYHNAGHAAATALLERDQCSVPCANASHLKVSHAEYEALTALAGTIGERMFVGAVEPQGAKNDLEIAFRYIATLTQIPGEQAAYVNLLNVRAEHLLSANRAFIEHIARVSEDSEEKPNDIARADVDRFV